MLRKFVVFIIIMIFLTSGLTYQKIGGHETEIKATGICSEMRIEPTPGCSLKINTDRQQNVLKPEAKSVLASGDSISRSQSSETPAGDPGSGWIYDVLISDQGWNLFNEGYQSMEIDTDKGNYLYIIYESWTDFVTGTYQWCLCVRRSTNGGETWSPEIWVFAYPALIYGVYPDMKEPDIAIDNLGNIWITYTVFAYDGPAKNIIDMQVFTQTLPTASWGTGPWNEYMITDNFGPPYCVHRLPSITIDQVTNKPIVSTMTYDDVMATQTSVVAWQWDTGPSVVPWDGWLVIWPINANYVQYPCIDAGSNNLYITAMYYYEAGGVFDMIVNRSVDGGYTWELVGDFYDVGNVYSFYKPTIASTKSGTDYVMCAGTYTPDPSDQSLGEIGYAYSLNDGTTWDAYNIPMSNYQRMPYVQEDFDKTYFLMSYRQEDGGPTYSTRYILASTADLTNWFGPEIVSDTGAHQPSNWFAHVAVQRRPDSQDYPCIAWTDLRDAAEPYTKDSQTHIVYSTYGARYTIDTDPTGLDVIVDSVTYTAPQLFNWPAGYDHTLEAPLTQIGGGDEEYQFINWTDDLARVHSITTDLTDDTFIAYYEEMGTFDVPVTLGWNFISFPITAEGDVLTIFDDDGWNDEGSNAVLWDIIYWYDPTDATDPWKSYNKNWGGTQDMPDPINNHMGFWIHITDNPGAGDGKLTIGEGYDPSGETVWLEVGWNLVGFPSLVAGTAADLPGWGTTITTIGYYNDGAAYDIIETSNGATPMSAGNAYWIYSTITQPWNVGP